VGEPNVVVGRRKIAADGARLRLRKLGRSLHAARHRRHSGNQIMIRDISGLQAIICSYHAGLATTQSRPGDSNTGMAGIDELGFRVHILVPEP